MYPLRFRYSQPPAEPDTLLKKVAITFSLPSCYLGTEGLALCCFSYYISRMNVTQTVDVPTSHRLTIDVPHEVPAGRTILVFKPAAEASVCMTAQEAMDRGLGFGSGPRIDPTEAIRRCSGIMKRFGFNFSSDDFLAMRRQDKELEDRLDSFPEAGQ